MPIQTGSDDFDFPQVIKNVYDPATDRLMVESIVTDGVDALLINPDGSINVNGSFIVSSSSSIKSLVYDASGNPISSTSGALNVSASQSGTWTVNLATEPTIDIGKVDQGTGGSSAWKVDGSAVTQPISAASLPLPSGAATSTNQSTQINQTNITNTSLADMETQLSTLSSQLSSLEVSNDAIETNTNNLALSQGGSISGALGNLALAAVRSSPPTYIDATTSPLNVNLSGGLRVDGSGVTQPISATALPLPTGAATNSELVTINTTLGSPIQQTGGTVGLVAGSANIGSITNVTGTVSLPTGAATSALQTTGNSTLTTINTTLGSPFQAGGSIGNTTFASTQSGTWNINNISGTISLPTGAATNSELVTINSTLGSPMQQTGGTVTANAGSGTFTVDASGHTVPISAVSLPLPTGAATSALQTTGNSSLASIVTNTANIPALGQALAAGSVPVVLTAAQLSTLTPLTSVTVTQSSGANLHVNVDNFPGTQAVTLPYDENWGTVGATTLRTAAEIGNAAGAANFNAGATGAQTLRVAANNYDGAGNALTSTTTGTQQPLDMILPDGTCQTVTANFTTAGNNLVLQTNGASQCSFQANGTWTGLIAAYASADGSNYQNVPLFSWTDFSKQTFSGDTNLYSFACGGFKSIKIDAVTLTSGTANVVVWLNVGNNVNIVTSPNAASFLATVNVAAGTNVIGHVITDSSSTTAATQATASNLNAQVQGPAASGASKSGNPVQVGGVFNTTQPTVTTGQMVEAQSTARGALIVSTGVDNFNINNVSGTVSLPTGAATSALQTTGNTSLASIVTNTNGMTVAQASTTSGQVGQLMMGAVTTSAPTYASGNTDPLSLKITGELRVDQADLSLAITPVGNSPSANNVVMIGGYDGSNVRNFSVSTTGVLNVQGNTVAVTPGSRATTAFTVQEVKDTARTLQNYYAVGVASGTTTTETAITLNQTSGTGSTSSAVSFIITSGKIFRITGIAVATRGNSTATAQATVFSLRVNTGGAVTTASTPVIWQARSATPATSLAYDRFFCEIPDGMEIAGNGTLQFGMTAESTFTTNAPTWDVLITGFLY